MNTENLSLPGIRVTRGYGLLEPLLAKLRARLANSLIPNELRDGRILDIGCGSFPYFLSHTSFEEKFAIDQNDPPTHFPDIQWHSLNLNDQPSLPFPSNHFNVITLLAVIEHLDPSSLIFLFTETHRSLRVGGRIILTTPVAWSDGLLKLMARLHLVSPEEIIEHIYTYTLPLLGWYFGKAGYEMKKIRFGYFEFGLNLWAMAEK